MQYIAKLTRDGHHGGAIRRFTPLFTQENYRHGRVMARMAIHANHRGANEDASPGRPLAMPPPWRAEAGMLFGQVAAVRAGR